jgi:hypothetical protein
MSSNQRPASYCEPKLFVQPDIPFSFPLFGGALPLADVPLYERRFIPSTPFFILIDFYLI